MLIDAHELPNGTEFETDICIIGSGAAGITIAKSLENSQGLIISAIVVLKCTIAIPRDYSGLLKNARSNFSANFFLIEKSL